MRRLKTLLAAACLVAGLLASVMGVQAASQKDLDDPGYYKYYGLERGEAVDDETEGEISPYAVVNGPPYTDRFYTHDPRKNGMKIVYGVDVSKWQGKNINWEKVKADGIEYAFIRAGYSSLSSGSHNKDECFDINMQNARAAGLKIGVYYYAQATTAAEAKSEAAYLLELIKGYTLDYPVVFDAEEGTYTQNGKTVPGKLGSAVKAINDDKNKTAAQKKNAIKNLYNTTSTTFCDIIQSAGYTPMIYGGMDHCINKMDGVELSKKYMLWIPRYNDVLNDSKYTFNGNYQFWQYTDKGIVDGISGSTDCNFLYLSGNEDKDWKQNGSGWNAPPDVSSIAPVSTTNYPGTGVGSAEVGGISNFTAKASGTDTINLSWNVNGQAAHYVVFRADAYEGTYKKLTEVTGNSYSDKSCAEGREYYYYVAPVGQVSGANTQGIVSTRARAYTSSDTKVYVNTWDGSLNMRTEGDVTSSVVAVIPNNTKVYRYCETRNPDGVVWYKVKYTTGGTTYKGYISSNYSTVAVIKMSGTKQSSKAKTSLAISWAKQSGVTAYQIYRAAARNGKYTKIATIKDLNTKSYKDTGLKANREYWYKIRAYSKVNGKTTYGTAVLFRCVTKTSSSKVKIKKAAKLYQYAGTAYKKVVSIPKNTKVTVVNTALDKKGAVWYLVKYKKGKKTYNAYIQKSLTQKV